MSINYVINQTINKMRTLSLILGGILIWNLAFGQSFKEQQLKCSRVKSAYAEKWQLIKEELKSKGMNSEGFELFIRAFKQEQQFEVWIKPQGESQFRLFKTYSICSSSGVLGPKRMQGDGQVPEGFYHIAVFNPYSNYHLSLGVNYPNASDKIIGKGNLGGDIMIHGNCVTIGCIPLTDEIIKEVYVLSVEAKNKGQEKIPVHIFPLKMNEKGFTYLKTKYAGNATLLTFWTNIYDGYASFEKNKKMPIITVNKQGLYEFK